VGSLGAGGVLAPSFVVCVAVCACGASAAALVMAPVDPPVRAGPSATASIEAVAPEKGRICRAVLRVGPVVPTPGSCWIDERVGKKTAALTYPCAGGAAEADFGTRFEGTVDASGSVLLEAKTTFHFGGDNCTWQSLQQISGRLSSRDLDLVYTYEEHPIEGRGCAPAECTARVAVRIGGGQEDGVMGP